MSKEKTLKLILKQTQAGSAFPNLVPVEITTPSGKHRVVLKPKDKQTIQEMKLDEAPSAVSLDPENTVLKEAVVHSRSKSTSK